MSTIKQDKAMDNYECYCSTCREEFTCFPRPSYCVICGAELEESADYFPGLGGFKAARLWPQVGDWVRCVLPEHKGENPFQYDGKNLACCKLEPTLAPSGAEQATGDKPPALRRTKCLGGPVKQPRNLPNRFVCERCDYSTNV